jgi:hypothetical protein
VICTKILIPIQCPKPRPRNLFIGGGAQPVSLGVCTLKWLGLLICLTESCEQCRKRKLKCDRGLPCSPCRRSRQALECTYGTTAKAKSPANRGRTSSLASEENHPDPKDPVHDSGDRASTLPSVDAGTVWPSNATGAEPTPRPHLRTDQEKAAKFFGQSHWINALGQVGCLTRC